MLSLTFNSTRPTSSFLHTPFLSSPLPLNSHHKTIKLHRKPISAALIPANPKPPGKLYQPFRPPPSQSPIPPQFRDLDTTARLDVLTNRLGMWYEYAPLIPPLFQEGFDPSTLEEITGIAGAEQNRLVVGAQVRESLVQSGLDAETLHYYENDGAGLLYEIRLLTVSQRAATARYMAENKFDVGDANELARAIKDFPRRRGDRGWDSFDYTLPADCLAFMYYRQALENRDAEMKTSALEKALSVAVSEPAKTWITKELEGNDVDAEGGNGSVVDGVKVPVVRLNLGEIAEATVVAVLPVCGAGDRGKEVEEAPWEYGSKGDFGIVEGDKDWKRWVVLPAWEPVVKVKKGGVVVAFSDARALPWRVNRWYKEEPILVVVDRRQQEVVSDDGFYLVLSEDELKVERGSALKEKALKESLESVSQWKDKGRKESLGSVVIVVRPPKEDTENEFAEEDWE
ncbi:putative rubisco accumulation factor 1 [Helianthus annuus]|uniref:Rubisco accumulation factor 1 n=1 Tax=Helianthus annuus TaxID=4232 RepID=A0A251SQ47_HELAN|nr:rubisco accumulation factor 1.1, chloroplastic [Helianthus annuus]KAF5771000.1 putative rubisco accumulation factor 1 [Helianthus annuus]KAJ0470779.1 putative rubisco accumulation factor 1 [Helianthus annuus]KAJ0487442.1 putative rubisco accumulation factor 1 [Helianthus annuus]KAJ0657883.1 putative rubisco accumulation factor 1 [Helianthus annuus]KAJ0842185.1 putative rubisco accumulation factor 1 [Helianthus annuus]